MNSKPLKPLTWDTAVVTLNGQAIRFGVSLDPDVGNRNERRRAGLGDLRGVLKISYPLTCLPPPSEGAVACTHGGSGSPEGGSQ